MLLYDSGGAAQSSINSFRCEAAMQVRVQPVEPQQTFVRASFHNSPMIKNEHQISATNRTQPVSHDKGGSARKQGFKCRLQSMFGLAVHAAGGFIQNQDGGIGQHRAGKADQLSLATAETAAGLSGIRIQTVRQRFNQITAPKLIEHVVDIRDSRLGAGEANIISHAAAEKKVLLRHNSHAAMQRLIVELSGVVAVDEY